MYYVCNPTCIGMGFFLFVQALKIVIIAMNMLSIGFIFYGLAISSARKVPTSALLTSANTPGKSASPHGRTGPHETTPASSGTSSSSKQTNGP